MSPVTVASWMGRRGGAVPAVRLRATCGRLAVRHRRSFRHGSFHFFVTITPAAACSPPPRRKSSSRSSWNLPRIRLRNLLSTRSRRRTPDLIVQPNIGHTYSGSTKKQAEHGGFEFDDTNVMLLVSDPSLRPRTVHAFVRTNSRQTPNGSPEALDTCRAPDR